MDISGDNSHLFFPVSSSPSRAKASRGAFLSRVGVRIAERTPQSRGVLTDSLAFPHVRTKIEKEKKEHAKLHGMIRTEISGAEIAEEMEKERRYFQLQMCEVGVRGGRARWACEVGGQRPPEASGPAPRGGGCCCPLSAPQGALGSWSVGLD